MPTDPSGALYKSLAYEHHLREARGQATATIANYVPFIRTFLKDRFGDEKGILWASNPSKRSLLHSRKPFLIRFSRFFIFDNRAPPVGLRARARCRQRTRNNIMNAQTFNSEELHRRTLERRAVEAAIWGMPIVSVHAMREAFFRDAKANYNDIVFWSKPSDWQNQTTTPNASARYVYFNFNTQPDGPVVLEIPAAVGAGLFGTLLDAWQMPLAASPLDSGKAERDASNAQRRGRSGTLPNLREREPRRRGPRRLAPALGRPEAVVDRIGTRRMGRRESPCVRQRFSRIDLSVACAGLPSRLWASAGAVHSANKSFPGVLF